jgi:hypothetical protein
MPKTIRPSEVPCLATLQFSMGCSQKNRMKFLVYGRKGKRFQAKCVAITHPLSSINRPWCNGNVVGYADSSGQYTMGMPEIVIGQRYLIEPTTPFERIKPVSEEEVTLALLGRR